MCPRQACLTIPTGRQIRAEAATVMGRSSHHHARIAIGACFTVVTPPPLPRGGRIFSLSSPPGLCARPPPARGVFYSLASFIIVCDVPVHESRFVCTIKIYIPLPEHFWDCSRPRTRADQNGLGAARRSARRAGLVPSPAATMRPDRRRVRLRALLPLSTVAPLLTPSLCRLGERAGCRLGWVRTAPYSVD